jgi:radical SAM superfamily enzyme YgiQ (UPF0313 family)
MGATIQPMAATYALGPQRSAWRFLAISDVSLRRQNFLYSLRADKLSPSASLVRREVKHVIGRLIAEGLNTVPWTTVHGMKVNHTDLELFQLMKAAGCTRVGFGVENGDPWMLRNVIRKGQTLDQVREAFKNAKAANLQTMGFFIFGMPNETEETMDATIDLALELDPDLANFMLAAPFPGTKMWDMIREGGEIFANEWPDYAIHEQKSRFTMNDGVYDPDLVLRKWREAYRRFYLYRPQRVWEKMSKKSFWLDMPNTVSNARRFFVGQKDQNGSNDRVNPEEPVTSVKGILDRALPQTKS